MSAAVSPVLNLLENSLQDTYKVIAKVLKIIITSSVTLWS